MESSMLFPTVLLMVFLSCLTGICAEFDPESCPPGRPFENCTVSPCSVAVPCDPQPDAVCEDDFCGGCVAKYYHPDTGHEVHCETEIGLICELKNVTIGCHIDEPGKVMKILMANYGRLDTVSCRHPYDSPDLHNTTDCGAANSTEIVEGWCNGMASCHPIASNEFFGDPCYGVYKYLLIDFTCEDPGDISMAPVRFFLTSQVFIITGGILAVMQNMS